MRRRRRLINVRPPIRSGKTQRSCLNRKSRCACKWAIRSRTSRVHVLNYPQQLREGYFSELNATKSAEVDKTTAENVTTGTAAKAKPKLKKKAGDDPFASDDEQPDETKPIYIGAKTTIPTTTSRKPQAKVVKPSGKDGFASDNQTEEDSDEEARKAEVAAKKKAVKRKPVSSARSKRPKGEGVDEEVDDRPKKIRR